MKLKLAGSGTLALLIMSGALGVGCGSGGATGAAGAQRAPASAADVLAAMESELANAIPGTTTLTSAYVSSELPDSRGSLAAAAREAQPSAPPAQTWGGAAAAEAPPTNEQGKSIYEP